MINEVTSLEIIPLDDFKKLIGIKDADSRVKAFEAMQETANFKAELKKIFDGLENELTPEEFVEHVILLAKDKTLVRSRATGILHFADEFILDKRRGE